MSLSKRRIAPRRVRASWEDYEQAKREWAARNPLATPEQYQRAMARIAEAMGL